MSKSSTRRKRRQRVRVATENQGMTEPAAHPNLIQWTTAAPVTVAVNVPLGGPAPVAPGVAALTPPPAPVPAAPPPPRFVRPSGYHFVGDEIELLRAFHPEQIYTEYREGTRFEIVNVVDELTGGWSNSLGAPGSNRNSFMAIALTGVAPGKHYNFRWIDSNFKLAKGYDPYAPQPPKHRFADLILPLPMEAEKCVVQVAPTPRVTASFKPRKRTTTVQIPLTAAFKTDLDTPHLAMSMELPLSGHGKVRMAQLGGGAFHIWQSRNGDLNDMAPWVWANVYEGGTICWGKQTAPGNLRAAWSSFWDFPTNEHLSTEDSHGNQLRYHDPSCRLTSHECQNRNAGLFCARKHPPEHAASAGIKHHKCANAAKGQRCGKHVFLRLANQDWMRWRRNESPDSDPEAYESLNALIRENDYRRHHWTTQEQGHSNAQYYCGVKPGVPCHCNCCMGHRNASTIAAGYPCGCPVQKDGQGKPTQEARDAWACQCCNSLCRCMTCNCCSNRCACPTDCKCCSGTCDCSHRGCTCGLKERFECNLQTYTPSPERYKNTRDFIYGKVFFEAKSDAFYLSDAPDRLAKVPERFQRDKALVGTAKRVIHDDRPSWFVTVHAPDGETHSFVLSREEANLCV